jgi:hypothetical protein
MSYFSKSFRAAMAAVAGTAMVAIAAPARATPVPTVTFSIAGSPAANAGSAGNFFDVLLTNNSSFTILISDAHFKLNAGSPDNDITFTGATTATATPYLFSSSQFGPNLVSGGTLPSISVADSASASPFTAPLAAGATMGLGRIFYSVSAGAPTKSVALTFAPGLFQARNFEDGFDGDAINNSLSITAAAVPGATAVPLPASVWSGMSVLVGMAAWGIKRRAAKA